MTEPGRRAAHGLAPPAVQHRSSPRASKGSGGPRNVANRPSPPISRSDLEILMTTLEVNIVRLTECWVSPGWRLEFPATDLPAIHYNLAGSGRMIVGSAPAIALAPHTLVIAPAKQPFRIDVALGDT